MPESIWIFQSVVHGGLIARRDPHYYQYILDPATGEDTLLLTSGEMMPCPVWSSVRVACGLRYGEYCGRIYDITDLTATTTGSS